MTFEDDSPSIACPHCGHTISAQARFCRRCGKTPKSAPPACAKCGAVAEAADALFCSGCGGALVSSATDSETKPLTVATPVRRSASVEPIPLSSLPERGARKIWPWVVGLAILAASTVAVATHRENLATWLHVLGIPQTAHSSTPPPMKAMEAAISAYYDAIGNQDFKTAYSLWTPSMQKGLTPSDLANQWYSQWLRLGANGTQVNVNLNVTMSEPPDGDFVSTTVTETEPYPDGYVRKKVLKGGWHVVNIGGHWLLNERDFRTVADNGPPPSKAPTSTNSTTEDTLLAAGTAEANPPGRKSTTSAESGTNGQAPEVTPGPVGDGPDTITETDSINVAGTIDAHISAMPYSETPLYPSIAWDCESLRAFRTFGNGGAKVPASLNVWVNPHIKDGTRVWIVKDVFYNCGTGEGEEKYQVRILDGPYSGRTGYIGTDQVTV